MLSMKASDSMTVETVPKTRMDTTYMVVHELVEELMTIKEDSWAIQLGAFTIKRNATRLQKKLQEQLGKEVEIVVENGFHKVRILELKDRDEVDAHPGDPARKRIQCFLGNTTEGHAAAGGLKEITDTIAQLVEVPIDTPKPEETEIREEELPEEILEEVNPEEIQEEEIIVTEPEEEEPEPEEPEVDPIQEEIMAMPMVSLQVGVFEKRSEALRAQRR